ncbi:hypothetical protein [Sediminicurvatus halobius]|uniref:Hemerythrin-like domain-containing protein n=1 Tax=Sediminicurvatus halobius TaxID=2182432 RepID=A0A2U2MXT6_9GAMM|nr:hypothetical protein [Spiribacter halobius]PWG61637.1 hypothetical protein DEM34_15290 [Spiribacter halobius]UEX79465.1 hypothetical protein LMH63_07425 [Spiribacter halobius]
MSMARHLHTAHADLEDALGLLERELLRFREAGEADLDTVGETLYFLIHHGELPRYARERLVYHRLSDAQPPLRRLISAVERRQSALREEAQRLMETVEDMAEDVLVPKAEFDARAERFLRRQRHQLAIRRRRLLPLAERLLAEADWQAIESELSTHQVNRGGSDAPRPPLGHA